MKIIYTGAMTIDLPAATIYSWVPGEVREVPDEFVKELLARGDFVVEEPKARKKSIE